MGGGRTVKKVGELNREKVRAEIGHKTENSNMADCVSNLKTLLDTSKDNL